MDIQSYPPVHYSINYTVNDTGYSVNTSTNSITIGDILPGDVVMVTVAPTNILGAGPHITTTGIYWSETMPTISILLL